jgi:hypothetical protein
MVDHYATKFFTPHKTTTPHELVDHPKVEVVFNLTSDESHASLARASLKAGKNVFIEKPVTLSLPSLETIIGAEKNAPNGARAFVGHVRRYAPTFREASERELASIPQIIYAPVRDFSTSFVDKTGTFPVRNFEHPASASAQRNSRLDSLYTQAFPGQETKAEQRKFCRFFWVA